MSWYRRFYIPGGTYFFTVKTAGNLPVFASPNACRMLGRIIREAKARWPFEVVAIVLLPDHVHSIWSLPPGDDRFPLRWGWIKKEFTKAWVETGGVERAITESQRKHRRRGVWQKKYWEHAIRDEEDFTRHFDYVHFNPVKHGYARHPAEWLYSSFGRWVSRGVYPPEWGRSNPPDFSNWDETTGE